MMDLRISVVLFLFLTGGYSLKCYTCSSALNSSCEAKVETCGDGSSKCQTQTKEQSKTKGCALTCKPGIQQLPTGGTITIHCCDTDLCNTADGVYKGSFLLLLSPLLFYFLFQ